MGRSASLVSLPVPGHGDGGDAREAIFRDWLPVVLRWCSRLGGPYVDPEDAAHDILITVLTRMHTIRDPAAFPSWIFGVTRRTLAWHRRKAWVRRWVPGLAVELPSQDEAPEGVVASRELQRRVQALLEQLPAELREVLVLCDLEERPDEAVAELLGIPSGTVKSRLRRARQRFALIAAEGGLAPVTALAREET